jgi:hypothetical protein
MQRETSCAIGREQDLANYQWEFNLLQDKQLNAWCMPEGKVAVYTGILPVTKDDNGLAVVMGHEYPMHWQDTGTKEYLRLHWLNTEDSWLVLHSAMVKWPVSSISYIQWVLR